MYPDYISAINRLDYNVGRLVDKLKELGIYDDTIIIYTSDHGSHFKTRNPEYKRSCHESASHTPLIIKGGGFEGGKKETRLSFMQISESQCGRAIRTDRYKYAVRDLSPVGYAHGTSKLYFEDYLYDLEKDPIEKHNLIKDPKYAQVRKELKEKLIEQMVNADEAKPAILPAIIKRKK